jgi:hypothetical protein
VSLSIHSLDWRRAGAVLCILVALAWPTTGILFTYANWAAPLVFDRATLADPAALATWVTTLAAGGPAYVLTYVLFALADFSILLLGSVLREVVGRQDFRGQIAYVCVMVGMLLGLLVDVMLLSQWLTLIAYGSGVSPAAQAALWTSLLQAESLGLWLSVACFLLEAGGLFLVARAVAARAIFRHWSRMSVVLALTLLAEVAAILWDVTTHGSSVLTGGVFLLLAVIVAPAWAIWLAWLLGRDQPDQRDWAP